MTFRPARPWSRGARSRRPALLERELAFAAEISVIVARGVDGCLAGFPGPQPPRRRHPRRVVRAGRRIPAEVAAKAIALATDLATGMGMVGLLTVELFLMPDGALVVNELAPRVHNSGHWTIEGAATSQFEQHVRAICGLPLGPTELHAGGVATVNLPGNRPGSGGRGSEGVEAVLELGDVHVHLYDKRRVFERRKMGHVTAMAAGRRRRWRWPATRRTDPLDGRNAGGWMMGDRGPQSSASWAAAGPTSRCWRCDRPARDARRPV